MIKPLNGKVLVEMHHLVSPFIVLPETITMPPLSVAEIAESSMLFIKGQKVLVPTMAGLDISENGDTFRLINESDVVARLDAGIES